MSFDGRADLYALGCVAFWLLTGRAPFEADDAVTLMQLHASAPPPPPSALSELPIPSELDTTVLACLAKDPRDRPASADVLVQTLDRLAAAHPWQQRQARSWWELHEPELSEHR
jgi:serine/threonine-protein kinase